MESLSKQQIILLALLVSFVTSIATGIMTASLLENAPPVITQTVNRVVERTVERVVPEKVVETTPGKTVIERETVVVKEDELVPASVEKNGPAVVRIFKKGTEAGAQEEFASLGVIVTREGTVLAPHITNNITTTLFRAVLFDGSSHELVFATTTVTNSPFSLFSIIPGETGPATFPFSSIGMSDALRLGQTVIGLGGAQKNEVSIGIVSSLDELKDSVHRGIGTNLYSNPMMTGSPLLNLNGQLVGIMEGGVTASRGAFLPVDQAKEIYRF